MQTHIEFPRCLLGCIWRIQIMNRTITTTLRSVHREMAALLQSSVVKLGWTCQKETSLFIYRFHIGTSPLYLGGLPLRSSTSRQSAIVGYSCCYLVRTIYTFIWFRYIPINIWETHRESAFNYASLVEWISDEARSRQRSPGDNAPKFVSWPPIPAPKFVSWPPIPASKLSPGEPNLQISKWNLSSACGQCRRRHLPVPQRHRGQDSQALLLRQGLPPRREIIEYRFHIGTSPLYFGGLPLLN